MLNSVENQDGADMVQLLQNSEDSAGGSGQITSIWKHLQPRFLALEAPITNDVQSKEDEYWSSMWQMTRSMPQAEICFLLQSACCNRIGLLRVQEATDWCNRNCFLHAGLKPRGNFEKGIHPLFPMTS